MEAMKDIKTHIISILKKYTFNEKVWEDFNEESSITNDLKINSARIVDIIIDIEEYYDISISDEELNNLNCLKNITGLVSNKTK